MKNRLTLLLAMLFGMFSFPVTQLSGQRVIPVVVHVVHDNGIENISDTQVLDMILILNEAFNLLNSDTSWISPEFQSLKANMGIEFCLASIDPNGLSTTGVDRIEDTMTYYGNLPQAKLNQWPPDRYMNFWTFAQTDSFASVDLGLSPIEADIAPDQDGIVMWHHYVGSIGTGDDFTKRLSVHMVGHYLGLVHLWEYQISATCGDDSIADTPMMLLATAFNCVPQDACDTVFANDENFMIINPFCPRMFTLGQKERVDNVLNSSIAGRDNLWTAQSLTLAGVAAGCSGLVGIEDFVGKNPPRVFPNPADETITLVGFSGQVEVLDGLGRRVLLLKTGTLDVDVRVLSPGSYTLRSLKSGQYTRFMKI